MSAGTNDRLPTALVAAALIRRVHDSGGFAAVRAKGDPTGGAMLLLTVDREHVTRVWERGVGADGVPGSIESTPREPSAESVEAYWRKRRARDPDLWVIELDSPEAERFAAETLV